MKISTKLMLNILYVLSWIIFIGISIEAGSFITNAFFALVNPAVVKHLWHQVDLSALFKFDHGYFFVITLFMSIVAVMKALLFYLIIKIIHENKLNMAQPFNKEAGRFIFNISYIALFTGLFSWWGVKHVEWLVKQGVQMPDIQHLHLGGGDVWMFMSITFFIIGQIFKRGIEIQTENELTV